MVPRDENIFANGLASSGTGAFDRRNARAIIIGDQPSDSDRYRVMTDWYAMKLPIRLRRCDYPCGPK